MKLVVKHKTGFSCIDNQLLIFDKNKIPFYFRDNNKTTFKFNLPVGTYYTENNLVKLNRPCFYTSPKLKPFYFNKTLPNRFKIVYENNPNKCSVDLTRGIIIFDNSFKNEPRFIKDFIKFHELGHYRYSGRGQESEKDCDNFSVHCMIKIGYNPSQINVASKYTLGENHLSVDRKINNTNYLQAFKQY